MSAGEVFVVIEITEISDPEGVKQYQMGVREQFARFGGTIVARGGVAFEGEPGPLMIQRWPSEAAFRAWQASDDYRPMRERRLAAAKYRMTILPVSQP